MNEHPRQVDARYEVADELYQKGYDVVVSHDKGGHVDVVALSNTHVKLILVRYDREATSAEKEALVYYKAPKGHTQREIWTKTRAQKVWRVEVL